MRADEFGRIAERIARLAVTLPEHYAGFARTVHTYTGAEVFVRAGSTAARLERRIRPAGAADHGHRQLRGASWLVYSFEPAASTRVYVLAPPG